MASARAAGSAGKPSRTRPERSASTRVGRNGQPGGIVKTRGRWRISSPHARGETLLGGRDRPAVANMQPLPVEAQAAEPPGRDRAVEEQVGREGAVRRVGEELRLQDRRRPRRRRASPPARGGGAGARPHPWRNRRRPRSRRWSPSARAAAGCPCAPGPRRRCSRRRFGCGPSIQSESELRVRKGSSPRSGSAFFRPPPVSSSASRSSEIDDRRRACGRADALRRGRRGGGR